MRGEHLKRLRKTKRNRLPRDYSARVATLQRNETGHSPSAPRKVLRAWSNAMIAMAILANDCQKSVDIGSRRYFLIYVVEIGGENVCNSNVFTLR